MTASGPLHSAARRSSLRLLLARAACASALLGLCVANVACDTSRGASDNDSPIEFHGGRLDASGTFYETASWSGPYLFFPSGRKIDIFHGLGTDQLIPTAYLSFAESVDLTDEHDERNLA